MRLSIACITSRSTRTGWALRTSDLNLLDLWDRCFPYLPLDRLGLEDRLDLEDQLRQLHLWDLWDRCFPYLPLDRLGLLHPVDLLDLPDQRLE